jgi:hypothetical protein
VIAANRSVAPETARGQIQSLDAKKGVRRRLHWVLRLEDEGGR